LGGFDVRRLAAVDMYGASGGRLRRRVILVESLAGVGLCSALGLVAFVTSEGTTGRLLGAWLIGVGINYLPLALHALSLSRPGALEAALAGVDVPRELRAYTWKQVLVLVPLVVAVLGLVRYLRRGRSPP
jgi:hypothetical protein